MTDSVGSEMEVALSEVLLARMLRVWWSQSELSDPFRISGGAWNPLAGSAEARLDPPVPRPRSADGGRLRLDCRAEIEMSYGLGGRRNVVFEWALLVLSRVEVDARVEDASSACRIVIDFPTAEICDLRVATVDRFAGWKYDPGELDPFSDWRWRETGRIVASQLLRRAGERRLPIPARLFDELARVSGNARESFALHVGTERVRLGWLATTSASGTDRAGPMVSRDVPPRSSRRVSKESLVVVGIGKRVVEDWLARRLERLLPGVQVSICQLVADSGTDVFEFCAELRPALGHWPSTLRLRVLLKAAVAVSEERIRVLVHDVALDRLRLPTRLRRHVLSHIRAGLERVEPPRRLDLASLSSFSGPLRVDEVAWDPAISRWEIGIGEGP